MQYEKYTPLIDDILDSLEEQDIPAVVTASPDNEGGYNINIYTPLEDKDD